MNIAGYLASIFIGIALGLIGGGGSILTVPVLVYLFNIDPAMATAYSLFIVGTTSTVGSFSYLKNGLIDIRTAIIFGIPSILSIFFTRTYLIPAIPTEILNIGNFTMTKSVLLMLIFAVLMIFASYSMIKKSKTEIDLPTSRPIKGDLLIIIHGIVTGIVTGLVGAGGGFLIIPALVNFLGLDIKKAIGTSLLIISLNSLFGFAISLQHITVEWGFLMKILVLAIIGVLTGSFTSKKIDGKKLKPAFGFFVLIMGIYIIIKEIFIK